MVQVLWILVCRKASFLRLSALTLAYTFPTKVINALKLTTCVFMPPVLIFCLTNYNGYDPETGDWYPPTRMYTLVLIWLLMEG